MFLFLIALVTATAAQDQVNPDIVYKYTDAFQLIWRDEGSDADLSGAVWRALNYQSEYCSLGDVATANWDAPSDKAVFVSQRKSGALVSPSSFTRVWNDQGSGSDASVTIYRMNAPAGYTCLGAVAVKGYSAKPDSKKYCCVKNEYVVKADTVHTWNDRGSGASLDVSLWTVIRAGGDALGINAGSFISVKGYARPDPESTPVFLLKADNKRVRDIWSLPSGDDKPLNLHEVAELKLIWNDAGSGASMDVSVWRAESRVGYYPPGDIAVATHRKPRIGFLLRPTDENVDQIRAPVSYSRVWNDAGSDANRNIQIWRVNCPGGYVSLGDVATNGKKPELGSVYCVNSTYTTYGTARNWRKVWVDQGSEANSDVTIYEAKGTSGNQQAVRGFGTVSNYHYKPQSPYLLNKDFVTYWAEKPIEKIYMYNVEYDLKSEKQMTAPVKMSPTIVENKSHIKQKVVRTLTYSKSATSTFTFNQAVQLGIAVEITAGSPIIGAAQKTTISASFTSSFTSGSTNTTSEADTIAAWVELPGKSQLTAVITGTQYKADIPYTATIKKVYYDGSQAFASISGMYKGVAVCEVKVTYSEIEPIGS